MKGASLLAAALLSLAFAGAARAGGSGFEGEWVAKELSLQLSVNRDLVNGTLTVGASRSENELTLSARLVKNKLVGTLRRNAQSVKVTGWVRRDELELWIEFESEPSGRRYYTLRRKPQRKPFRSVFEARGLDLTFVLESKGGPIGGWLRFRDERQQLRNVRKREGGGLVGELVGRNGAQPFAFTTSSVSGAMDLAWGKDRHQVRRLPDLPTFKHTDRSLMRRYRHPQGYLRCDLPAGWTASPPNEAGFSIGINAPGAPLVIVTYEKQDARERTRTPLEIMKAEKSKFPAAMHQFGVRLTGQPVLREVLVDDRRAAYALWGGIGANGLRFRVWVGLQAYKKHAVALTMICQERTARIYLPKIQRVFDSLRIVRPPR